MVKLAPGSYTGGFEISGKSVTIFGSGATLNAASGIRTFGVVDNSKLRLVGLTINNLNAGYAGQAVACESLNGGTTPIADLEDVKIEASQPILANPCTMTVQRSRIHALGGSSGSSLVFASGINAAATVLIDRSTLGGGAGIAGFPGSIVRITNSVIANVAGPSSTTGALNSSGRLYVSFSTVINSPVKCSTGTSSWPPCAVGGGGAGVCFDNSIVLNTDPSAPADTVVGGCVADYTVVYPQATALVGANNRIGVNPVLADVVGGDYHLSPLSPAIDAADPAASMALDLDGTERPQGQRLDMGAFEYKL
ncbi:MAG TPA: choice-of-anchor Q domain-containing protein [Kofleriaceae bacterium]